MNEAVVVKRFIAGAVCPACEQMDTIRMFELDGVPNRECVACGYADTLDERGNSVPREIPTRVTQPKPVRPAAAGKTVQFFPNPKLKKNTSD